MAAASRSQVLSLYKQLMRESQKFPSYNFKSYAVRRVRDAFKENKSVNSPEEISSLMQKAEENLGTIKRQVLIGQMYKEPLPHAMEYTPRP